MGMKERLVVSNCMWRRRAGLLSVTMWTIGFNFPSPISTILYCHFPKWHPGRLGSGSVCSTVSPTVVKALGINMYKVLRTDCRESQCTYFYLFKEKSYQSYFKNWVFLFSNVLGLIFQNHLCILAFIQTFNLFSFQFSYSLTSAFLQQEVWPWEQIGTTLSPGVTGRIFYLQLFLQLLDQITLKGLASIHMTWEFHSISAWSESTPVPRQASQSQAAYSYGTSSTHCIGGQTLKTSCLHYWAKPWKQCVRRLFIH